MTRTDIINTLIQRKGYSAYLEIGVRSGDNLNAINCETKVGVDINPMPRVFSARTKVMPSRDFWSTNFEEFDIIFIDGSHLYEDVFNDIRGALGCISPRGTIIVHDMNPLTEESQSREYNVNQWHGDGWKAWVRYRALNNLYMRVVDTDSGCGVINIGQQQPIHVPYESMTFKNLDKYRKSWLNLISVEDFLSSL